MKRLTVVSCVLAFFVLAPGVQARPPGRSAPAGCHRLFWMGEGLRFARRIYSGAHRPTVAEMHRLGRMEHCQHNGHARRYVHRHARRMRRANAHARWSAAHQFSSGVASWYNAAGGPIACGGDSYAMGVANRTLPCGTRLEVCYSGCVDAVVFDRGPYVAGRDWDLSGQVRDAIGFPDGVATIRYRFLH